MSSQKYLLVSFVAILLFSTLFAGFNYRIDPYLIFGSARTPGLNDIKVDINEHVRTSKAYQPYGRNWDVLLVGNSRIEMGLNPEHACFQDAGKSVYNIGIPGAGVRQQLHYALNVIYDQPVEQVFISVDFVDFLVPDGDPPPADRSINEGSGSMRYHFDGSVNRDFKWNSTTDKYQALFSLDALMSSAGTVLQQSPRQSNRTELGFNPANDFAEAVSQEGPRALFEQKLSTLERRYDARFGLYYRDATISRSFASLEKFLDIATEKNTSVTLFTNPFHDEFWRLLDRKGLSDLHTDWVRILQARLRKHDAQPEFWDFSSNSMYIHEALPLPGAAHAPLRWFWEPSHYRSELGDLMLNSMLANDCGSSQIFGRRIL